MRIYLNEISDQETELDFTQNDSWVLDAICQIDERLEDAKLSIQPRPAQVHFSLRKVDDVFVVSGKIETYIELICSRCAVSYQHSCTPSFSALFCKDPVLAGVGHLSQIPSAHGKHGGESRSISKPSGQNYGHARHAHQEDDESGMLSESKDLDITYLSHEYIDLSDVLTEQLQLQVPFQPLCQENCKGVCTRCGTDLNQGHCACAKISNKTPFSVLKDFKV